MRPYPVATAAAQVPRAAPPSDPAAVRSGAFRFHTPLLLFARVRLYTDRLELTGWRFRGRYRRVIALRQLLHADALGDDRLVLWLADGEALRLHVERAPQWQAAIALQLHRGRQQDAHPSHP